VLHYAAAKAPAAGNGARSPEIEALRAAFDQALDDDLNTPQALAVLDQLGNLGHQHAELLGQAAAAIREKGGVLGLFQTHQAQSLSPEQRSRLDEREAARQRRDFKTADAIRKEFDAAGLTISDTPDGPVVIPK
jgi:cysteinyl-tRNA synthetase